MNYIYDYSKLLGRLREKQITQSELANELGISEVSLNRKLNNRSQFKQNEMIKTLDLIDLSLKDIASYFFAH